MSSESGANIKQIELIAKLFWGALLAVLLIYGIVVTSIEPKSGPSPIHPGDAVSRALQIQAVCLALISLALQKGFLSKARIRLKISKEGMSLEERERSPDWLPQATEKCINLWFFMNVLSWALNEGIAITGVLLAFLQKNMAVYFPFFGAALILQLLMFPRLRPLTEKLKRI